MRLNFICQHFLFPVLFRSTLTYEYYFSTYFFQQMPAFEIHWHFIGDPFLFIDFEQLFTSFENYFSLSTSALSS